MLNTTKTTLQVKFDEKLLSKKFKKAWNMLYFHKVNISITVRNNEFKTSTYSYNSADDILRLCRRSVSAAYNSAR